MFASSLFLGHRPCRSRWGPRFFGLAALVAGCVTGATAAPHTVPDTMAQRVAACAACHGKEGRAGADGYLPRIAGKPAGYLYNQLINFREGRRQNAAMVNFVEHLTDAYLRDIADHFSVLDLPYAAPPNSPVPPSVGARGETLALRGDAARQLPACADCHGARLTGMLPATPGLLGLPRDYLLGQLGAWRSGERRALAPDCMAHLSERLAPDDVAAVAAWLSLQAVPADSKPVQAVASLSGALTQAQTSLHCGSAQK